METKWKELENEWEREREICGGEIRGKNKAKSLCGLCAFDVFLVFSWEADNQSLTTSLYHLTGSWGEECVCVCECVCDIGVGGLTVIEIVCYSKNRKDPGAQTAERFASFWFSMSYKSFADTNIFPCSFPISWECVKLTSICRGADDGGG